MIGGQNTWRQILEQGLWPHYYVLGEWRVSELAERRPGWFCSLGLGAA